MAILAQEVLVGNVGGIYEKRVVGKDNLSVIDFSIAVTPRKRINGEWADGDTYWVSCTAWGRLADNIEKSFKKGDRVFVVGNIDMKSGYTSKDGNEVPPRPYLNVTFAGIEIGMFPAEYKRPASKGDYAPKQEAKPKAPAAKPKAAPKKEEPAFSDDDLDFDFDFDDEDEIGSPF